MMGSSRRVWWGVVFALTYIGSLVSGNSWSQKWYDASHTGNFPGDDRRMLWSNPWLSWSAPVRSGVRPQAQAADVIDQATVSAAGVAYYVVDKTLLVAADVVTGQRLWNTTNNDQAPFGSVAVVHEASGVVLVLEADEFTSGGGILLGYDARNLSYCGRKTTTDDCIGSPVIHPITNEVIVSTFSGSSVSIYGFQIAYPPSGRTCSFATQWEVSFSASGMLGGPVVSNSGVVYAVTQSLNVSQLHAIENGAVSWTVTVAQPASVRLVRPDGTVVVVTRAPLASLLFGTDGSLHGQLPYQVMAALGDNSMLAFAVNNAVVRLNASGQPLWSTPLADPRPVLDISVDGSSVAYVTCGDTQSSVVDAFAISSGAYLWGMELGDYGSGAAVIVGDGTLLVHTHHTLTRLACCSGHGNCTAPGPCECAADYYGAACDVFCTANATCSGVGTCTAEGGCACFANYYDANCTTFCSSNDTCPGLNWQCNSTGTGCECMDNWFGDNCTVYCTRAETCSDHGTCQDTGGCSCDSNYFGASCDAVEVNMTTVYIVAGVVAGVVFLVLVATLISCVRRSRRTYGYESIRN
eukprot:TRINITY_DN8287_c0_g1_i1.p1 TRINITY_DN8287_c0_g1~~TRINITY_DN8287_c0_g1_i1.p1  ORF type:complete len:579 (+),score=174.16 TRINITY_DN8287_c0_g1_i1:22-1758(+)